MPLSGRGLRFSFSPMAVFVPHFVVDHAHWVFKISVVIASPCFAFFKNASWNWQICRVFFDPVVKKWVVHCF